MYRSNFSRFVFAFSAALSCGEFALAETNAIGDCPPSGYTRPQLEQAKANDFVLDNDISDDAFALILANCLGSPNPVLRDGIAYEGLVALLRGDRVSNGVKHELLVKLSGSLHPDVVDQQGFVKPFAALALAEVARTDRLDPYLTQDERQQLVQTGADYLVSINDFRGFHASEGWRHGVAHTADLLMQLALNDNIGADEHRIMLAAISSKVAPPSTFYIYGESARLARPVLFIAASGTFNEDKWTDWLADIAAPHPLAAWSDAFDSDTGLARLHNTSAFLTELYLNASLSQNDGIKALLPGTIAAIKTLQ